MRKRFYIFGILIMAVGLGFVFSGLYQAAAVDAPHNLEGGGTSLTYSTGCLQTCHTLHGASGGSLNQVLGNVDLCVACHTTPNNTFVLPANNVTAPGTVGIHHQYKVPYNNSAMGTTDPRPYFTYATIENNNIVCSSCHQVHAVDIDRQTTDTHTGVYYGDQKTSIPPGGGAGSLVTKSVGNANQQLYVNTIAADAPPMAYKVKIVLDGGVGTATFIVSYDGGISWFGWNGASWQSGISTGRQTAASVAVDNNNKVTVKFSIVSGTYAVNDEWVTFYVSYPFLRGALDSGDNTTGAKFCRNCHGNRANTYQQIEGPGDGTTKFSHPVGQTLNANSQGYDRAVPLDVNGQAQGSSSDTIASNNLRLDGPGGNTGNVQCWSCHNIHFGDSNSLTKDSPVEW